MALARKFLDKIFYFGILLKSLFGFFEVLAGFFVALPGQRLIDNFLIDMALDEISRDPNDFIAKHIIYWSVDIYLAPKFFAVAYLLAHGIINILLAISLAKNKIKFYPFAILVYSLFIIYQSYKYYLSPALPLLFLTIFDVLFVLVILFEYKKKKKA